jgi:RNA polymerase sigma-70 factor (ECF subfamily)
VEPAESTATLLSQVRGGDNAARERLVARYLPLLRRWARGRLPARARDLNDTNDLVQITLLSALNGIERFKPRREGAFLAYLRTSLMNNIRMELRRIGRHGSGEALDEDAAAAPPDLAHALGIDDLIDYEAALAKLSPMRREAVILRFEFGMSFAEIAAALERPTAAAAHMLVSRAVVDLARELG